MLQTLSDLPAEYVAYLAMKPELLQQYPEGTYIAFLDGVLVGTSADVGSLITAMRPLYPTSEV